jgi:selenide, water dikinase
LLVGIEAPDDAALWKLDERRALVVTTDFFTPVVDDAYDYGAIAAANAISDVYAMGGQPFLALNIAALPPDLPVELSAEILRGGAEKAREAGVVIAGGHTVQDKEPKYGLVVLGFVDPQRVISKNGARVGDQLYLSKPLGFGATTTALKRQVVEEADLLEAVGWMKRLNRDASLCAQAAGVRGGTDVTGFSLIGHASEVALGSRVRIKLHFNQLPFLSGVRKYAEKGIFPGGAFDNQSYFNQRVHFSTQLSEVEQLLLFDPQTSGGLLLAVAPENEKVFISEAERLSQPVWKIGEVVDGAGIEIVA